MNDLILKDILKQLSRTRSQHKQLNILKDLYLIGHLDAFEAPKTPSSCLEQISVLRVAAYGCPWVKLDSTSYVKKNEEFQAILRYESKGHKICKGLVLSTTIGGSLKKVKIKDMSILDAKKVAEQILLDNSGSDCRKIRYI